MSIDSVVVENRESRYHKKAGGEAVGDVRIVRTGNYVSRERITELIPAKRFSYVILDGVLLDYKGNVELMQTARGGTWIEWSASYRMRLPGAAWLMKLYLKRFMQRAVSKLAQLAEEV